MNLNLLDVAHRLLLVDTLADGTGNSLSGQNVNELPAGALVYVRARNRLYSLRKNLDSLVVAGANANVVDGVGSSAAAGRFVAVLQWGVGILSAGSIAMPGWDLTRGGFFAVNYVSAGGTQGFLHAAKTANGTATVTSSSGSDTSTVLVQYLENAES